MIVKHNFIRNRHNGSSYKLPESCHPSLKSGWHREVLDELHKTENVIGMRDAFDRQAKRYRAYCDAQYLLQFIEDNEELT